MTKHTSCARIIVMVEIFSDDDELENGDFTYDLTPYHFNMDVEGLLRRFQDKDILIPSFQRNYVWTKDGASMFIDSVLRGLPTPSLFFYEETSKKYLVIDGQQRLLTLYFYINGFFPDKKQYQNINVSGNGVDFSSVKNPVDKHIGIPFTLSGTKIFPSWKGKAFKQLTEEQQKRIKDTYVYIINLKQTAPADDNSSMYLVFERINTGSTPLNPQQIRLCVSHGSYAQLLCDYAKDRKWSEVFNLDDKASVISELILRFFSLYFTKGVYKGAMKTFLDKELKENREFQKYKRDSIVSLYEKSFFALISIFNYDSFVQKRSLMGYFLLATWISLANIIENTEDIQTWVNSYKERIRISFEALRNDNEDVKEFITNTRRAGNTENLQNMISILTKAFRDAVNG